MPERVAPARFGPAWRRECRPALGRATAEYPRLRATTGLDIGWEVMDMEAEEKHQEDSLGALLVRMVQDDRKREQLRSELSGFTHRCRNVLSCLKTSLYLVKRDSPSSLPAWWPELERNYSGIERLLNDVQTICRPMSPSFLRAPFRSFVRDRESSWRDWFRDGPGSLEIAPPAEESAGDFDPTLMRIGWDALVRWRAEVMRSGHSGRLSWRTSDDLFHVRWMERRADGASGSVEKRECRGGLAGSARQIQTLALPLLTRVIRSHQGSVHWTYEPAFQVDLSWPREQAAPEAGPASLSAGHPAEPLSQPPVPAQGATPGGSQPRGGP